MRFRVFTNDVGRNRYSCLNTITAGSQSQAIQKAIKMAAWETKVLAIPEDHRESWPDGQTGQIKPGVFERFGAKIA